MFVAAPNLHGARFAEGADRHHVERLCKATSERACNRYTRYNADFFSEDSLAKTVRPSPNPKHWWLQDGGSAIS